MLKHPTSAIQSLLHRRGQMSTTAIVFLVLGIVFFVMVLVIWGVDRAAVARRSAGTHSRADCSIEEQPEANWISMSQLSRRFQPVPAGRDLHEKWRTVQRMDDKSSAVR